MARGCKYHSPGGCRKTSLYVVSDKEAPGTVKIGISFHPKSRLSQHRKKTGRDLRLYWTAEFGCEFKALAAEEKACRRLDNFRVNGDWFAVSVEDAIRAAAGVRP